MNLKAYKWFQEKYQEQLNLTTSQKFALEHLLYKKMKSFFDSHSYNEVGFLHTYHDDIENFAIIDELLTKKTNINIYYSEIKNKAIIFNQINDLFAKSEFRNGYLEFSKKKYLTNKLDIVVIPLQGYYDDKGLIFEINMYEYLKNFNGVKLGYVNKKNKLEDQKLLAELQAIKLDKIILV